MSRPLRLEFADALYHVTSRGDRREDIYHDDADRQAWLTARGRGAASQRLALELLPRDAGPARAARPRMARHRQTAGLLCASAAPEKPAGSGKSPAALHQPCARGRRPALGLGGAHGTPMAVPYGR